MYHFFGSLVQVVHSSKGILTQDDAKVPGVFMMVVPAETVEETLDELLPFCVEGDIIIDHGNSNFKDSRRRQKLINLASNILTVVLVVVFTAGAWILSYGWWCRFCSIHLRPLFDALKLASVPLLEPMTQTGIFSP